MPQNSWFCLCSFTLCLLQLSPVWLSALSHKQTTKCSKQRCPPCPEISPNGPCLSSSGFPPLAAHWFTNTAQTHFSVLQLLQFDRSVCLPELLTVYVQINPPATLFFWYFHSLSSLCTHTLTWSETFLFAAPSAWNSRLCQIRSSNTLTSVKESSKSHLFRLSCSA